MKRALSIVALSALAACGGGGGGTYVPPPAATSSAPAAQTPTPSALLAPLEAPTVMSPNCTTVAWNRIDCDLIPSDQAIGIAVPAGSFATFTNRTGSYLQIDQVSAYTAERDHWSEFCADLNVPLTGQSSAGNGEVGCSTKNIGEDYAPITWGNGTGLSVAPDGVVYVGSHTEPAAENHTYSLSVAVQTTGLNSWRQPQIDQVIACDGQQQSTAMSPWQNTTGRDLHLTGASIYSETASSSTPNTMSAAACVYVLTADGSQKYSNCDSALKTRGEVAFPAVTIAPGEFVAAQAVNSCNAPNHWNWAVWLRVW